MSLVRNIIIHVLANSAAIWAAAKLISGFKFTGEWSDLLIAGTVLGIINAFIRPVLKLLTFPIILLTLGLFTLIINMALLYLADNLLASLQIESFRAGFFALIVISIVNNIVLSLAPNSND